MFKFINSVLVLSVLVTGFLMYSLEHSTRDLEREITRVKGEISDSHEAIKLLNAEWSSLTRPDRIQELAEKNLDLTTLKADQIVKLEDLLVRVPETPPPVPEQGGDDPIGEILKKMQR